MSTSCLSKIGLSAVAVAFVASCTSQPVVLPSRDFNRPTDVAFVCMGAVAGTPSSSTDVRDAGADRDGGAVEGAVLTGLPMRDCHPRGAAPATVDLHHRTYAFLPNSESGTLSIIDADTWKLVNLDPQNAGYNALPLGTLPTQIATSDDGCRLVTANHGSCDLSLVDPAAVLAPTFSTEYPTVSRKAANPILTTTIVPKTKSGITLNVLPGEVAFLPRGTLHDTKPPQIPINVCGPDWSWQAIVTFPSCDLVTLLDMPSGTIAKAAYVRRTTDGSVALVPIPDGATPVCPITDCAATASSTDVGGGENVDASVDGAAKDGGDAGAPEAGADAATDGPEAGATPLPPGANFSPLGVGPLALVPETGRVYVGMANSSSIVSFDVATNVLAPLPGGGVIALNENAIGVNRLRLSIDPYLDKTSGVGSSGISGTFVGDTTYAGRQYLYAVARDGTLRVVQVAQDPAFECETNYDPLLTPSTTTVADVMKSACIPVDPTHRRPGAIGPGIRPPAPPVDVAVANISPKPTDQSETSVSGVHAWMLTASGNVYLVNIDPIERLIGYIEPKTPSQLSSADPSKAQQPPTPPNSFPCLTAAGDDCEVESLIYGYPPPPNTLRNSSVLTYTPVLGTAQGLPRLDIPSSENSIGPRIESVWTLGSRANDLSLTATDYLPTEVYFPDLTSVTPQTWNVTWQGALTSSPSFSGEIKSNGALLQDLGANFCRTGVEPTDLVTITGCVDNTQCGVGKTCVTGNEGTQADGDLPITGLCLAPGTAEADCDPLLSTVRRYEVTSTHPNTLAIRPHKDELVRPSIAPCQPTKGGADGGADGPTRDGGTASGRDGGSDGGGSDGGGDGGAPDDSCIDPLDPSTDSFRCIEHADGPQDQNRCLVPCKAPGSAQQCRTGRVCVDFGSTAKTCDHCFCADGPRLDDQTNLTECLGELFPYQASVGRGFLVSGSQTGVAVTQTAGTANDCVPIAGLDSRVVSRISLDAAHCTNVDDDDDDSRCYPNPPNTAASCEDQGLGDLESKLQKTDVPSPSSCLFLGGPNLTDLSNQFPRHVRTLFRNRELQFLLTNLEQPISTTFQIRFDVHGGFQPQLVTIPSTVEVTLPSRIVVGPFDSSPPVGTVMDTSEVPYLFVVDQRRLGRSQGGGPTRGQFLRIQPRGFVITTPVTGYAPWFEDLTNSLNLFPIQ